VHSTCYRCFPCWHEGVKILLTVKTLEVMAPLALVLNGDVTIFTFTMAVELSPKMGCSNVGHWHAWGPLAGM
jgi:hypothetical protein